MIQATDIRKTFGAHGARTEVLRGISLTIEEGTLTAIVGRSGSGKSTLLHILAGLEAPDMCAPEGVEHASRFPSVKVGGVELVGMTNEALAAFRLNNVGLVFQFFNFLPTLTILENVSLPAYLSGTSKSVARELGTKMLARVGIAVLGERLPHEVSGGELQRAAIARAIINKPRVIYADEPTGNLDRQNGGIVLELFRALVDTDRMTVVLVTHDPSIEAAADTVSRISDGVLVSREGHSPDRMGAEN